MKEFKYIKASGKGKNEEYDAKEKGWNKTIEDIFSLVKEMAGRTPYSKRRRKAPRPQELVSHGQEEARARMWKFRRRWFSFSLLPRAIKKMKMVGKMWNTISMDLKGANGRMRQAERMRRRIKRGKSGRSKTR